MQNQQKTLAPLKRYFLLRLGKWFRRQSKEYKIDMTQRKALPPILATQAKNK